MLIDGTVEARREGRRVATLRVGRLLRRDRAAHRVAAHGDRGRRDARAPARDLRPVVPAAPRRHAVDPGEGARRARRADAADRRLGWRCSSSSSGAEGPSGIRRSRSRSSPTGTTMPSSWTGSWRAASSCSAARSRTSRRSCWPSRQRRRPRCARRSRAIRGATPTSSSTAVEAVDDPARRASRRCETRCGYRVAARPGPEQEVIPPTGGVACGKVARCHELVVISRRRRRRHRETVLLGLGRREWRPQPRRRASATQRRDHVSADAAYEPSSVRQYWPEKQRSSTFAAFINRGHEATSRPPHHDRTCRWHNATAIEGGVGRVRPGPQGFAGG